MPQSVTVQRKPLAAALAAVAPFVPKAHPTGAAITAVRITASPEGLTLTGTDLDNGAVLHVPVEWGEGSPWEAAMPPKRLSDLLAASRAEVVTLSPDGDAGMRVRGGVSAQLAGVSPESYPDIPQIPDTGCWHVVMEEIRALAQPAAALASETSDTRPALQNICLGPDDAGDGVWMVGSDGYSFDVAAVPAMAGWKESLVVPPGPALSALSALSGQAEMRIAPGHAYVFFSNDAGYTFVRMADGAYPHYWQALRAQVSALHVARADLLSALSAAGCVYDSGHTAPRVRMEVGERALRIQAVHEGAGAVVQSVPARRPVGAPWQPIKQAFNVTFLRKAVDALKSETVTLLHRDHDGGILSLVPGEFVPEGGLLDTRAGITRMRGVSPVRYETLAGWPQPEGDLE